MDGGFSPGYAAKPGSRLTRGAVQRLGTAIDLLNKKGGATPEALEEMARDPSSPIHRDFEWDDAKAAYQYRLQQARYYLRSIVVEWVTEEDEPIVLRAFNPTYNEKTGDVRWTSLRESVKKKGEIQVLLSRAREELRAFRKKYKNLRALSDAVKVMQAIDDFVDDEDDGN